MINELNQIAFHADEIAVLASQAKGKYLLREDVTVTLDELRDQVQQLQNAVNQLPELLTPKTA